MSAKPKMIGIRVDIETRSGEELKRSGVYRYAEHDDFRVLTIAYSPLRLYPDGSQRIGKARTLDLASYDERAQFRKIIQDPRFQKHAYNAAFERIALSKWLGLPNGMYMDPANWRCTAVKANVNGVFGTLDEVARGLRSPIKKDTEGKRLIRLFSVRDKKSGRFHAPCLNGNPCWCGADHRDDFEKFEDYCRTDVITEAAVAYLLPEVPDFVQAEYEADQRINDRGVRHFKGLAEAAVREVEVYKNEVMAELKDLTGLDNPNSGPQFNGWLDEQDYSMASLDKAHRTEALADPMIPDIVREALILKGMASLSSVTKHKAALATRCADGRIRGSLQFYGAHTGREAGRGIQPQNLPRYEAPPSHRAALVRGTISTLVGVSPAEAAKGTVRASLVPARGNVFVVCDYNAIEARVLAGLCGEQWAQDEFRAQGKIYEATAEQMFAADKAQLIADLKACGKCGKLTCAACVTRSKAKVANLALGYAGGPGALVTMGAAEAGIDVGNYPELNAEWKAAGMPGKFHEWERDRHDYPELIRIRDLYREASPMTTRFWKLCAKAWDIAASGKAVRFGDGQVLAMVRDGKHNRLVMPSGRSIWYRNAMSHRAKDRPEFVERRTFIGKGKGVGHVRTDTHGGKLTENVTQAVARDVLFDLMMRIEALTAKGWPGQIVLHVHDEVVIEVPAASAEQVLADTIGLMAQAPEWGDFLIVKGEGAIMERYGK